MRRLLTGPDAAFLLVTSPDQAALADARYFRDRIASMGLPFAGFVLNRSWARTEGFVEPASLELAPDAPPATATALAKLELLARLEHDRVARDRALLNHLAREVPSTAFAIAAPYLGEAVEDLKGLAQLASGIAEGPAVG